MKLLLVHGWAGHPDLWLRMLASLELLRGREPVDATLANLGPWGNTAVPRGRFDAAIAHSAGVLWLLSQCEAAFDRIVSIGGCTRFCAGAAQDSWKAGWPPRVVRHMARQLTRSPDEVLNEFWKAASTDRTGHPNFPRPDGGADIGNLADGLQALQDLDCREQWRLYAGQRLIIAGTDDRIVTAPHTEACFPGERVEWLKTDSHWLPWTFPETCAALIAEMLEAPR